MYRWWMMIYNTISKYYIKEGNWHSIRETSFKAIIPIKSLRKVGVIAHPLLYQGACSAERRGDERRVTGVLLCGTQNLKPCLWLREDKGIEEERLPYQIKPMTQDKCSPKMDTSPIVYWTKLYLYRQDALFAKHLPCYLHANTSRQSAAGKVYCFRTQSDLFLLLVTYFPNVLIYWSRIMTKAEGNNWPVGGLICTTVIVLWNAY